MEGHDLLYITDTELLLLLSCYYLVFISSHTPFSKWSTEQVCGWLEDCGLGQYVSLARQWVDSGQTLLSATPQELEKVYFYAIIIIIIIVYNFILRLFSC